MATALLDQGGVEALTTRSLSEHAEIPVATIYQYFADRDAIILAYLDRELAGLDRAVSEAVLGLDPVTMHSVMEAMVLAHLRHLSARPGAVGVWFDGHQSPGVRARVQAYRDRLATRISDAALATGLLAGAAVPDAVALMVRMVGTLLEFLLLGDRDPDADRETAAQFVDMTTGHLLRFAGPSGHDGVPRHRLLAALSSSR